LFSDLLNHLSSSGFNILDKWKKYKYDVRDLDIFEKHLLRIMKLDISYIFDKLPIRFVNNYDSLEEDYQCSVPQLVFDHILDDYTVQLIYKYKMKNALTDE